MSDMDKLRAELLKDPEYKEYYYEMQPAADISKAIISARLAKKLTQKELSDLCGVTQSDISRLESCSGSPSLKTIKKIAKALNMRVKIEFVPVED